MKVEHIAVFGGTFNPIHNGHINLVSAFDKVYRFDQILLIPTKTPPHKICTDLASDADRLAMLELVHQCYPKLVPCDLEIQREGISYTVDTLHQLQQLYPNAVFYLIIGADMLEMFNKWRKYEQILKIATVLTGARQPGQIPLLEQLANRYAHIGHGVQVLQHTILPMSSTQVRQAVARGEDLSTLLPRAVADYIKTKGLYQLR